MKRHVLLLVLPSLFGCILAVSLLLSLKQTASAQATAVDGSLMPKSSSILAPRNVDSIFSPEVGWFSNKAWFTNAIAWVDLDGDGDLDLALANEDFGDPSYLVIYENVGTDIQYTPEQTITLASNAFAMAWGDMNGDGWPDVAVGMTETVAIYASEAGIVIEAPVWSSTSGPVLSVAWGDLDGDNDLDLAAAGCDLLACGVEIFENDGDILLNTPVWEITGSIIPSSLAFGDMDADGLLDLAVGYQNGPAEVYQNLGITLDDTPAWTSPISTATSQVAWADLDQDGFPELGVANYGEASQVYYNLNGMLEAAPDWENTSLETDLTTSLAWGDVDADGDPDLALGNDQTPTVLYLNESGSLSADPDWLSTFRNDTRSVAWGDMDNDGDLDLAVGMNAAQSRVMLNEQGTLEHLASVEWNQGTFVGMTVQAWGDVDRDGWMDLAAYTSDGVLAIYLNQEGIIDTTGLELASGHSATDLAWADVDGDGWLDLAATFSDTAPILFLNDGMGSLDTSIAWAPPDMPGASALNFADADGDGDLDLAVAGYVEYDNSDTRFYRNQAGSLETTSSWSVMTAWAEDVAWGDFDKDGDPDLAIAQNQFDRTVVYQNNGGRLDADPYWESSTIEPNVGVDWGDVDGDGDIDLAVFNYGAQSRIYPNDNGEISADPMWESQETESFGGDLSDADGDGDIDVMLFGYGLHVYLNDDGFLWWTSSWSDVDIPYVDDANWIDLNSDGRTDLAYCQDFETPALGIYLNRAPGHPLRQIPLPDLRIDLHTTSAETFSGAASPALAPSGSAVAPAIRQGFIPIQYQVFDPEGVIVQEVHAYYSTDGGGSWKPAVAASGVITRDLTTSPYPAPTIQSTHIYTWDVNASGMFGLADNVVFRMDAVLDTSQLEDGLPQTDGRRPLLTSTTLPFRVRGTQVRVMNGNAPVANALVYYLPAGTTRGGAPIADLGGNPFQTDAQGYLMGRAVLNPNDQLLALAPQFISTTYTTYFTNGKVDPVGVQGALVAPTGVQTLTVSAANPLILFDLTVSLEWDSSKDPAYLEQLRGNIQRASEYLYDFTNGQVALGQIDVYQNGDGWLDSHITVYGNNRLRPWAIEGGVVMTTTSDPLIPTLKYGMGQLSIGSIWNRYGTPGQSMGEDWPVILAHELSHYLLFQDDVYMGLDEAGQIIPIMTCTGSAMGDVYSDPANTEFIYSQAQWNANCAKTLANKMLHRPEWTTIDAWYPALVVPAQVNPGPISMPFDFTEVSINEPITPTAVLIDPVFYIDYANNLAASSGARAYLERSTFLRNLGAPVGGQNSLMARGAQVGDRLCVFDPQRQQFGCEVISLGDNRLSLQQDASWNPIISLTPVNSTTLTIHLSNAGNLGATKVWARLFPQYQDGTAPLQLAWTGSDYSGTFHLDNVTTAGMIQVWVDEPASEENPRREAILPFSVGGNPGYSRSAGGGGGYSRSAGGGGGYSRSAGGGGGFARSGNAPLMSPDGAMIFFTKAETVFPTGTVFTIQAMAGVPALPPGRQLVGQAYNIIASPGAVMPDGSVSVQYLGNDVTVAGADESDLRLYYFDGLAWQELGTILDTYYNMAAAPSQGPGMYALLASIRIPLYGPGWNLVSYPLRQTQPLTAALGSIAGSFTTVYAFDASQPEGQQWLVYDISHAPIYNTLINMEFSRGYWINVTETMTLYLSTRPETTLALTQPPAPPALFYGVVKQTSGFSPQAGMIVQAFVNGLACGQGVTQEYQGQIVYSVIVWNSNGCAVPGGTVTFMVGGEIMRQEAIWDNSASNHLDLELKNWLLFLPVTVR